jgi:hypothetical protein
VLKLDVGSAKLSHSKSHNKKQTSNPKTVNTEDSEAYDYKPIQKKVKETDGFAHEEAPTKAHVQKKTVKDATKIVDAEESDEDDGSLRADENVAADPENVEAEIEETKPVNKKAKEVGG